MPALLRVGSYLNRQLIPGEKETRTDHAEFRGMQLDPEAVGRAGDPVQACAVRRSGNSGLFQPFVTSQRFHYAGNGQVETGIGRCGEALHCDHRNAGCRLIPALLRARLRERQLRDFRGRRRFFRSCRVR